MLKFYVRHGKVVDIIQEIISFKQSKWLEKYIIYITQKRNKSENGFEKDFKTILKNAFYGRTTGNLRKNLDLEFIKKDDNKKIIKQQSKFTFIGIQKSYETCDRYVFKKIEVVMDKRIYLGFGVIELSKLHTY